MRCSLKFLAAFICSLMMITVQANANNGAWQIVEMEGAVRTAQPMGGMQLVSTGGTLDAGAILTTGMNGRAVLARGDQTIIVGPSSRMSLPAAEEAGMTRVLQDLGTLLFKVDKREKQHFRVETPVIAAVVKGTTFTVSASGDSHAVHVAEGAVEVSSRNGASRQLVTAGLTARVFTNNPSAIQMSASAPGNDGGERTPTNGELVVPTEIGADPLDFATLTDGLVQGPQKPASTATQARFNKDMSSTPTGGLGNSIAELRRTGTNNNGAARAAEVSNAGGNGNGVANGLVNGNGPGNSNAGGNGNGNGPGNSNAGGNGNGNGPGNSNAGGNGNGNGNGGGNNPRN
ncbi:MAG: FecR family protein [Pseudomonadota bacterium]